MISYKSEILDLISNMKNRLSTKHPGYVLVLGSNYCDSLHEFISSTNNSSAPTISNFIEASRSWSPEDKVAIYKRHWRSEKGALVNKKIAQLISAGYFSTVITTSIDTELEELLLSNGFSYNAFQVHVFGNNDNKVNLASYISSEFVHVFKLYGSTKLPDTIKLVPNEINRSLDEFREGIRKILSSDLIICGYVNDIDFSGIGRFIPINDKASTWIVDERDIDEIFQQDVKTTLDERLSSVLQINPVEFFNTLAANLLSEKGRTNKDVDAIEKYKMDASTRLTNYASTWLDRFINLSLSALPVKMRDMNRPYRTGKTVETSLDFKDAINIFTSELLAVLGEPGAGKTTLLQQRALDSLKTSAQIPIFVELSNYQEERNLFELILVELIASGISHEKAVEYFNYGGFLVLLDGLNEVDEELMYSLARDIVKLYRLYRGANQFVVTCRTAEWPTILNKDSKRLEVLSVSEEDTIKYLGVVLNVDQAISLEIFNSLEWGIQQLTHTPLILSMLASVLKTILDDKGDMFFQTTDWSHSMPKNKAALYKQFLQDFMERDLDEHKSSIPLLLHNQALAYLARDMMNSTLTVSYADVESILSRFYEQTQAKNAKYSVSIETLLRDVMYTPPMITSKGSVGKRSHLTFMHQSFQEYFTGLDLYQRLSGDIGGDKLTIEGIQSYIGKDDKRWWETIILLAGMYDDATELVEYIIRERNLYLAARCIRDSQRVSPDLVDKIIVYGLDNFKYDANFDYDMIYSFNMVFHKSSPNLPLRLRDDIKWWLGKYAKGEPRELHYLNDQQLISCIETKDESFLIDVIYTIGQRKLSISIEPMLNLLFGTPETVRDQIVVALGRIASPQCKEYLLKIVNNDKESPWIRAFALNSLGQLQDPDLIPALANYLLDPSNPYRDSAAWAIRKINHPSSKDALLNALQIQGDDVNEFSGKRYAIGTTLFALGDLGDKSVVPEILAWARDVHDPFILEDTMYALGQLGDNSSIPFILLQLENPDAVVRKRAINALVKLRAYNYIGNIREMVSDPSPFVREESQKAITELGQASN